MEDPHHVGMGRWKIPAGSIVIDVGLVLLIVYAAGQWTKAVENLDERLRKIENVQIMPESARRLSVLEAQIQHMDTDRVTMMTQLQRIEDKIDSHINFISRGTAKKESQE